MNKETKDGLTQDKKNKEIQEKHLPTPPEAMVHIHELQCFFKDLSNVEYCILVLVDRLESHTMTQSLHSRKQLKKSTIFLSYE